MMSSLKSCSFICSCRMLVEILTYNIGIWHMQLQNLGTDNGVKPQKDADRIANIVDPDQTALLI